MIHPFLTTFFLGSNSGITYALLTSTITAYLLDLGITLAVIGFLSIRTLPYSMKFMWAPVMDKHRMDIMPITFGKRKSWLISCQVAQIFLIGVLSTIDTKHHLYLTTFILVLIALASATFDVAADAYRIELLKKEQEASGNTLVVAGYRVGLWISATIALYMSAFILWEYVFIFVASCIFLAMLAILFSEEPDTHTDTKNPHMHWFKDYYIIPLYSLFKIPQWYFIFALIFFFKLSDWYVDVMLLPFLTDVGFSKEEIALNSKSVSIIAGLLGTLAGGFFLKQMSIGKNLVISECLAASSNLAFLLLIYFEKNNFLLECVSFLESFTSAISNLALFTYMCSLPNRKFTAMHVALFFSLSSLGRMIFAAFSGLIAVQNGWYFFFIFSTALSIPSFIFLWLLYSRKTEVVT